MTLTISDQTPDVRASVILRGRWSASIDEADAVSGKVPDDVRHLRSLARTLGRHQRQRSARVPVCDYLSTTN